jgi:hypothetical protein
MMDKKNSYTVEMDEPVMISIGFSDPEDALKFLAACGALATIDPEDVDANDLIKPLKRSAKAFGIYTNDQSILRELKEGKPKPKKGGRS